MEYYIGTKKKYIEDEINEMLKISFEDYPDEQVDIMLRIFDEERRRSAERRSRDTHTRYLKNISGTLRFGTEFFKFKYRKRIRAEELEIEKSGMDPELKMHEDKKIEGPEMVELETPEVGPEPKAPEHPEPGGELKERSDPEPGGELELPSTGTSQLDSSSNGTSQPEPTSSTSTGFENLKKKYLQRWETQDPSTTKSKILGRGLFPLREPVTRSLKQKETAPRGAQHKQFDPDG